MNAGLLIALGAVLLVACGSAPLPRPVTEEAAIQWNQRGETAYRRGEMKEALAAYGEALRLYSSVENGEGIAVALLNMATVHYAFGERDHALQALDRIMSAPESAIPRRFQAQAAYRRAYVDFDAGDYGGASVWLEKAQAACAPAECDLAGVVPNLKARVALGRDELASAEAEAQRGLDQNRRRNDAVEEANSLRLLADVALRQQKYAQALAYYQQALALDKNASEPKKIALDLLGAGRSLAAQGKTAEAAEYAERARRVAESIGDDSLRTQVEALRLMPAR